VPYPHNTRGSQPAQRVGEEPRRYRRSMRQRWLCALCASSLRRCKEARVTQRVVTQKGVPLLPCSVHNDIVSVAHVTVCHRPARRGGAADRPSLSKERRPGRLPIRPPKPGAISHQPRQCDCTWMRGPPFLAQIKRPAPSPPVVGNVRRACAHPYRPGPAGRQPLHRTSWVRPTATKGG